MKKRDPFEVVADVARWALLVESLPSEKRKPLIEGMQVHIANGLHKARSVVEGS